MAKDNRQQVTATILAGLLANPNVISQCSSRGWKIVNGSDRQLVEYAHWLSKIVVEVVGNEQQLAVGDGLIKTSSNREKNRYRVVKTLVQYHVVDSTLEPEGCTTVGGDAAWSVAMWQRNQLGDEVCNAKAEHLCNLLNLLDETLSQNNQPPASGGRSE